MDWILGILLVQLALFEWNMASYRRFSSAAPRKSARASVLVPCRNEAAHIEKNVRALLAQDYADFEVIVYDDDSDDGSSEILRRLEQEAAGRLRVISGGALEPGWSGKNRACAALGAAASGEWLLFTDADVSCTPDMLRRAVATAEERGASLVSTFPRQVFRGGDELIVPLMFFVLTGFLPMYFVDKKTWRWAGDFSAACGQFLLFRRDAYEACGGHAAVRARISEGPLMASAVKRAGHRIVLADGSGCVSCGMYSGFRDAFAGFSRSVFATMGGSAFAAAFFVAFQTVFYVVPPLAALALAASGGAGTPLFWQAAAASVVPLWMRARIHRRTGMPLRGVPLHALSMAVYNAVILNSFFRFRVAKKAVWKNRSYAEPQC